MDLEPTTKRTMHNKSLTRFWEEETITNADAIEFLESIPQEMLTGMSVVNKQFTKKQVYDIFMDAARDGKPEATLFPRSFKNMRKEFKNMG